MAPHLDQRLANYSPQAGHLFLEIVFMDFNHSHFMFSDCFMLQQQY